MSFLTPAYSQIAEKCQPRRAAITERAEAMVAGILQAIDEGTDKEVLTDLVALNMFAMAVRGIAEVEHATDKDATLHEHTIRVLLVKLLQVCNVIMDEEQTGERPFCCQAHLVKHVAGNLMGLIDPVTATLQLSDLMCEAVMSERRPDRYFLLDQVLDKLAKRQRRKCYMMAYGKEEGEKLAIEYELGLKKKADKEA